MTRPAMRIRRAAAADASAIAAIYEPVVRDTAITFELEPPTAPEVERRIEAGSATHPWLVAEAAGVVVAYAYAAPHRTRPAYRWATETSVYVAAEQQGRGVGTALYRELLETLRRTGFVTALAGIALPNPASVALHEHLGFERAGVFKAVGYKLGRWHDVGWWQLVLATPPEPGWTREC